MQMKIIGKVLKNLNEKRLIWFFIAAATALLNYYVFLLIAELLGSKKPEFIALMFASAVIVHEIFHYLAFEANKIPARMFFLFVMGGTMELKAFKEKLADLSLERKAIIFISGVFGNIFVIIAYFLFFRQGFLTQNEFLSVLNLNSVLILYNLFPLWIFDGGYFAKTLFNSINNRRRDTDYELAMMAGFVGILMIIMVITGNLDITSFLVIPLALHIRARMLISLHWVPFDLHIRSRIEEPLGFKNPKSIPLSRQKWWAALYLILILISAIIVANTTSWIFLVQ